MLAILVVEPRITRCWPVCVRGEIVRGFQLFHFWPTDQHLASSDQVYDLHSCNEGMSSEWLDTPPDVKLTLWCQPLLNHQASRLAAQQSCFFASQSGFSERVVYVKRAVVGHFSPYLQDLLNISEGRDRSTGSQPSAPFTCTCGEVASEAESEEGVMVTRDMHPTVPPGLCACQTAARMSGSVGVLVERDLSEMDLECEDLEHITAAGALLHWMYTCCGQLYQEVTPKMWLLMLKVYEVTRTCPGAFFLCPDVLAVASQHLRSEFGDAQKVLQTPSALQRFLKLPFTPVFAIMDRYENTCFLQQSRVELFDKWCCARARHSVIQQLCNLTNDFPLKGVYSLMPQIHQLPSFATVMQAARVKLHQRYGDVSDIIASSDRLESFASLPQPAVLVLLQSEDLVTDSEVTVMLLLDAWLGAGSYSADEYGQLQSAIRYSRFPSAYLTDQLEGRPSALPLPSLFDVIHFRMTGCVPANNPDPGWYQPSRALPSSAAQPQAHLSMRVSMTDITSMLKDGGRYSGPYVYAAGYLWRLTFSVFDDQHVWYGIEVMGVNSLNNLQQGVKAKKVVSCFNHFEIMKLGDPTNPTPPARYAAFDSNWSRCLAHNGETLSPFDPEWWVDYTHNGHVQFSGFIFNIDASKPVASG